MNFGSYSFSWSEKHYSFEIDKRFQKLVYLTLNCYFITLNPGFVSIVKVSDESELENEN